MQYLEDIAVGDIVEHHGTATTEVGGS